MAEGSVTPWVPVTAGAAVEAMPLGRVHFLHLAANMLLFIGNGACNQIVLWIFPYLQRDLGAEVHAVGSLFAAALAGGLFSTAALTLVESWGGRREMLAAFLCIGMLGVFLQSSAASLAVLAAGRMIAGFGGGAAYPVGMAYFAEFLPLHHRGKLLSLPHLGYSVGVMLGLLLVNLLDSWRMAVALTVVPHSLYLLLTVTVLPESPRYLSVRRRPAEAWRVVRWMYEVNRDPVPDWVLSKEADPGLDCDEEPAAMGLTSYTLEELHRQDIIRKCAAISSVWICLAFASQLMHSWLPYYLRQLENGNKPVNDHEGKAAELPLPNIILCQVADGVGVVLGSFMQDAAGYRWPLRGGLLIAGLATVVTLYPSTLIATGFGALQQGSQAFCWACIGSLATIAFPTVIRQSACSLLRTVEAAGMTAGPHVGGLLVGPYGGGIHSAISLAAFVYFCGFVNTWTLVPSDDPAYDSLVDDLVSTKPLGTTGLSAAKVAYGATEPQHA